MSDKLVEFRLRVRTADNLSDALEVTSVRGGTNPYISSVPTGDGASFDPVTGEVMTGSFSGNIIDAVTSGTSRLFTSIMEDANGRQQQGQRIAYWEFREDGGSWQNLYAGRLSAYRLASGIEWNVTVSDSLRSEHDYTLFDKESDDETITDFLTRWPNRGCILGGPIKGTFLNYPDFGGWECRVRDYVNNGADYFVYRLEPIRAYGPGAWSPGSQPSAFINAINDAVRAIPLAAVTGEYPAGFSTVQDTFSPSTGWAGLVALVDGVPYRPIRVPLGDAIGAYEGFRLDMCNRSRNGAIYVARENASQSLLTDGDIVKVRVLSILPTELSAIYIDEHPVDLVADLSAEAGLTVNATSQEAVRDLLGSSLRLALRITGPERLGSLLSRAIYGPFGIASRTNNSAEVEVFCTRIFSNIVPATTVTDDDVDQDSVEAFDYDSTQAIRKLTINSLFFSDRPDDQRLDGVVPSELRHERINDDPDFTGTGEHTYDIPGMVRFLDTEVIDYPKWVNGRALELFDRYGRGPITLRALILRTSAAMSKKLGDEILITLPQSPKANKRYVDDPTVGSRAMQIVHLTPTLIGNRIECEDSGPSATPYATTPTHTIAASTVRPRNVARLTITNAATLNADSAACRVQIAVTTGAVPAAEEYSDALYFEAGAIPTAAFDLPSVVAGRTIYARARAEKIGSRPSSWSTGVGVTLTAIDAPTGLSATVVASDGSVEDLAWTIGANAAECQTDILIRASGAPAADAYPVRSLPPGSTRYRLEGLTPNTAYTAGVRHRDTETGDVSATTEATFTTSATVRTLNPPLYPVCFAGVELVT